MEVDEDSLAFACPARRPSLNRDEYLRGDTGASSGLMERLRGGHAFGYKNTSWQARRRLRAPLSTIRGSLWGAAT